MARFSMPLLALGLLALGGCGAGDAAGGPNDGSVSEDASHNDIDAAPIDGDGSVSDAIEPPQDAGICTVAITVATPDAERQAPGFIAVDANLTSGFGPGLQLGWTITGPHGEEIAPEAVAGHPSGMRFWAGLQGTYSIDLAASVDGTPCLAASSTVQVASTGSESVGFVLMFSPRPDQLLPAQQRATRLVIHAASADPVEWQLSAGRKLESRLDFAAADHGAQITVQSEMPSGETVGQPVTMFAGVNGTFGGWIADVSSRLRIVVVPFNPSIAPYAESHVRGEQLMMLQPLSFTTGDDLRGKVTDKDGNPIVGAKVSVAAGSLPAALDTTVAGGEFFVRVRASEGPLRVEVAPPAGSGLAALKYEGATGPVAGPTDVTIKLDVAQVTVSGHVLTSAGQPIVGGTVTFVSKPIVGGSIEQAGTPGSPFAALPSETRVTRPLDAQGALLPILLPAAEYDVVVQPPAGSGETMTVKHIDLRAGVSPPPLALATEAPKKLLVKVSAPGAGGDRTLLSGARVTAVARGRFRVAAGETVIGISRDDVAHPLELKVADKTAYDLIVDPPVGTLLARRRVHIDAVDEGTTVEVRLFTAIKQHGKLTTSTQQPVVGGRVAARCEGVNCPGFCDTIECKARCGPQGCNDDFIYAETISREDGTFDLLLPDFAAQP